VASLRSACCRDRNRGSNPKQTVGPTPDLRTTTLTSPGRPHLRTPRRRATLSTRLSGIAPVLDRNIEALYERRQREAAAASWQERTANAIGRFAGSMPFVYLHLIVIAFWVAANLGVIPGIPPWDQNFDVLATAISIEAIFLSTFVLITQNHMAAAADKRADLDLQISLLTEHEITKLTTLVSEIASKLGVTTEVDQELEEIKQDIAPEMVLDEIDNKSHQPE
jgi:uncharacterized membrane protein